MEINLDLVPGRETGMDPYEFMLSESQERMLLVCDPDKRQAILDIAEKWNLDAKEIGHLIPEKRVRLSFQGQLVADLPPTLLTDEAPIYERPLQAPDNLSVYQANTDDRAAGQDAGEILRTLLSSANLSSRQWVYQQYDRHVGTDVVCGPGGDAGIMRLKGKKLGVAMSANGNGAYCAADPKRGALIAVAESARNLACVGADPLAITNCLNFGNPERPHIMWEFSQVIAGMSEACRFFETPVISGNVSFYNQHDDIDIPPTPVIVMCGRLADAKKVCGSTFVASEETVFLLGQIEPAKKLNGEVARLVEKTADYPECPDLSLKLEGALQKVVRGLVKEGVVTSAHDCSEGGLAFALAECCSEASDIGAKISLPKAWNTLDLFSEEQSRIVVSVPAAKEQEVTALADKHQCPYLKLGKTGGKDLVIDNHLQIPVNDIARLRRSFFEKLEG